MQFRYKCIIGLLTVLVLITGVLYIYEIKTELKVNDLIILNLYRKIDKLPQKIESDKLYLEKFLQQVNVEIRNITVGSLGSGVSIKYKGQFYILSAGHLATKTTIGTQDILELWENGQRICALKIIKHSVMSFNNENKDDFTKGVDLLLLKPINPLYYPLYYVELDDKEPVTASEIYIVGNPMGIEDVVSMGRIIQYQNNFMYYINHTYFGNSGGGIYTKQGKLIGIVSHMLPIQPNPFVPPYMTYGAVRLSVIQQFLMELT